MHCQWWHSWWGSISGNCAVEDDGTVDEEVSGNCVVESRYCDSGMVHASMIHSSLFIQSQNYAVLTIFCCIKSAIKLIDWLIDASGVLEVSQRCTQVYKYTFYLPTYLLTYLFTYCTEMSINCGMLHTRHWWSRFNTYALYRCVNQSSQPLHAFAPPRLRTACWGSVSCPLCTTGSCM